MGEAVREFEFTRRDFDFLRKMASNHTGIVLQEDKFNMLYSRLSRRIRSLGLGNFKDYCSYLEQNESSEVTELVNAVTTNLTSFFREQHHFDYLVDTHIPNIVKRNHASKKIRIWSAGCSTGEEPYSIAMSLKKAIIPSNWDVKILATDIDFNVLAHGRNGIYDAERIEGLPTELKKKWFRSGSGANAGKVRVSGDLQKLISFKQLNLLKDWPFDGPFDAIFCRNVVIYFDGPTKKNLVEKYGDYMHDDSCLFLGHSESLHRVSDKFDSKGHTVYQKVRHAA